jgi:hypothetical protein
MSSRRRGILCLFISSGSTVIVKWGTGTYWKLSCSILFWTISVSIRDELLKNSCITALTDTVCTSGWIGQSTATRSGCTSKDSTHKSRVRIQWRKQSSEANLVLEVFFWQRTIFATHVWSIFRVIRTWHSDFCCNQYWFLIWLTRFG